ncbi:replication protein A 70 kDa DNA-binding subunit D [Tanacetum coccineum]
MAVTHRHFEMIVLNEKGEKIHVIVRNGRLSYLNQYFREDIVGLMRNFNVIPNMKSYKFTNHPYKISFDRFSFARRSNTFNGDVNNTGFEVTKFCVIRSLNLDTDLPIDVTGEGISWESELREYKVYGSKVKVLPIKLKDAVYVVNLKLFHISEEKMLDYIISYEVKDKFLVNVENARVFDDGKDPPMIYIKYQTASKFDIVDGITKDVEGGCQGSECKDDYYFHKFIKFYMLKNRPLTVPSKFVARHRMNEFKVAILRYGNKDFPMELHQNIVKLSKGKKQMYLTMEEKENRKLMKLKCSKHISLCDSEDKREVMEEDKEAVVLDVNFVKIADTVKPEVDADVNDVVQLD